MMNTNIEEKRNGESGPFPGRQCYYYYYYLYVHLRTYVSTAHFCEKTRIKRKREKSKLRICVRPVHVYTCLRVLTYDCVTHAAEKWLFQLVCLLQSNVLRTERKKQRFKEYPPHQISSPAFIVFSYDCLFIISYYILVYHCALIDRPNNNNSHSLQCNSAFFKVVH